MSASTKDLLSFSRQGFRIRIKPQQPQRPKTAIIQPTFKINKPNRFIKLEDIKDNKIQTDYIGKKIDSLKEKTIIYPKELDGFLKRERLLELKKNYNRKNNLPPRSKRPIFKMEGRNKIYNNLNKINKYKTDLYKIENSNKNDLISTKFNMKRREKKIKQNQERENQRIIEKCSKATDSISKEVAKQYHSISIEFDSPFTDFTTPKYSKSPITTMPTSVICEERELSSDESVEDLLLTDSSDSEVSENEPEIVWIMNKCKERQLNNLSIKI